ncbi:DoxX family membrane protein [Granulicella sp. S190]|uniref:DoxX family membrane protein n=1 Tax=Granulicella sp. S190 TaxID=1747226 RepID=UPI00131AE502|nr:DoxX family membrane protein [Granulicella sp. S190]
MFTHLVFWLWFVGLVFLAVGLVASRKNLAAVHGLDKWIELGPAFVAAPLAVFSAEHFVSANSMQQMVPAWMTAHLFWVYFVGCALIAAATSLVAMKFVRLSATLLGVMFLLFVLMLHLPFAMTHPGERIAWTMVLRETAFACGAWALAVSQDPESRTGKRDWIILILRSCVAIAVIFFGVEQVLHPEFAPGVPDDKLTPAWIPLHTLWGYPVGVFLLIAGAALLLNFKPRTAAIWIGVLMTLLSAFLYLPILAVTHDPSQMTEAINFVADTLMFGGAALLLAGALPAKTIRAHAPSL